MNRVGMVIIFASLMLATNSPAMQGMQQGSGDDMQQGSESMQHGSSEPMQHGSSEPMQHGSAGTEGKFVHQAMADDVHTEFQVMDLDSMKMTDPDGKTHHVMASFMRNEQKLTTVVGKMKLVSPSGKEQVADLKDYGNGNYAANFTIDEPGKWGVICLFKDEQGKHTVKFWYEHHKM